MKGKSYSCKIANAGLISAVLVVMIHVPLNAGAKYTGTWWFHDLFVNGICEIAVPLFFCISGYFLAGHFGESGWFGREIGKRVKSLLVPYLIFNLGLYALLVAEHALYCKIVGAAPKIGLSLWGVIDALGVPMVSQPVLGVTWFLRSLFMFVLLSPAIAMVLRKSRWAYMVTFGIVGVSALALLNTGIVEFRLLFDVYGFLYFMLGCYLRIHPVMELSKWFGWVSLLVGIVSIVAEKCAGFEFGTPMALILHQIVGLPFVMYGIWSLMPRTALPMWICSHSFSIYLLHQIFFIFVSLGVKALGCREIISQKVIFVIVDVFVAVAFSVVLSNLMKKFIPRIARVVFGGR